jgi:hypothetical protein
MFERLPRESEFLSWSFVVLWSGIIYLTIPFVRGGVKYVRGEWGRETFTYVVAAVVILATVATVILLLKSGRKSFAGYGWLLGIGGVIVYLTFDLKASSPEEAVHYLQYGLLSLLLFRAFIHRIRDTSIYGAVTIAGTIVGMIDETIQWMTPGRYFGARDIWLNFTAVGLVQLAVALGIRPSLISSWPDGASWRRLCRLAAAAVAYFGLCHLNTPERIAWYTANIPLLGFIDHRQNLMVEYGYMLGDAETGFFRSRLTAEELSRSDRERGVEDARILDRYPEAEHYSEFLYIFDPVTDPFLHEARVHLFRRDTYLERARQAEQEDERRDQFNIAYWENRILEVNFGEVLRASSYLWPAELEAEVRLHARTDEVHVSGVSRSLVTKVSERQVFWLTLAGVVGLLLLGIYLGRRVPDRADMAGPASRR